MEIDTDGNLLFGGSFRATLVVNGFAKNFRNVGWGGPMKAVYHTVKADRAIILFAGGGDT